MFFDKKDIARYGSKEKAYVMHQRRVRRNQGLGRQSGDASTDSKGRVKFEKTSKFEEVVSQFRSPALSTSTDFRRPLMSIKEPMTATQSPKLNRIGRITSMVPRHHSQFARPGEYEVIFDEPESPIMEEDNKNNKSLSVSSASLTPVTFNQTIRSKN